MTCNYFISSFVNFGSSVVVSPTTLWAPWDQGPPQLLLALVSPRLRTVRGARRTILIYWLNVIEGGFWRSSNPCCSLAVTQAAVPQNPEPASGNLQRKQGTWSHLEAIATCGRGLLCGWSGNSQNWACLSSPEGDRQHPPGRNCAHVGVRICRITLFSKQRYSVQPGDRTGDRSWSQGWGDDVWANVKRICLRIFWALKWERRECARGTEGSPVVGLPRVLMVNYWPLSF